MPLTDITVRNAKPDTKTIKKFDSDGLFLQISPAGGKWWRFKYRFGGKEKLLSLGTYPDVSLMQAREKRDENRRLVAAGVNPSEHRKAKKLAGIESGADSFEVIAREWFGKYSPAWSINHSSKIMNRLVADVFPWLGKRPITEITVPELLTTFNKVIDRGAIETTHRISQYCGQIFRYAIATRRAVHNPIPDLRGAIPPTKVRHHPSITKPASIGGLLRAIDGYEGSLVTKCALRLAPLVFVRPGELRNAEWSEFDLSGAEWRIPAARMKMKTPHIVPLSSQAVAI